MTQLRLQDVVFEVGAIRVVCTRLVGNKYLGPRMFTIRRVSIDESVEEECVNRVSPVLWRRRVLMTHPLTPIVCRVCGVRLLVQVVANLGRIISKSVR